MKRIVKYLLVMILFVPFFVKADMGAPMLRMYKAEVIKESGADYYDIDSKIKKVGHFDKGTQVEIEYEEVFDKVLYLMFNQNEDYYYIKADDVLPVQKEVTPKSDGVDKLEYEVTFKVYADEVVVRKGPSVTYDTVGTLKKDATGKYKYYIDESGYIYAEANGLKGWVDTLESAVLFESGDYILGEGSSNKCGKIPVNTIVRNTWRTDMWTGSLLVEYKGCTDFIDFFKIESIVPLYDKPQTVSNAKSTKLYATIDKKKVLATIPKDTTVEQITMGGYYEYGEEDKGHEDDILTYVDYNGTKGWAYMPRDEYPDGPLDDGYGAEEDEDEDEEEPTEPIEEEESKPVSDETLDCEDDEDCEESVDRINIPLVCTIVGVAIALAALVTIVIVNKKKKNKAKEAAPVEPTSETPAEETKKEE